MAQAVGQNHTENRKAKTEQGNEDDGENCANQAAGQILAHHSLVASRKGGAGVGS